MDAVLIENLRFSYPAPSAQIAARPVLDGLALSVKRREIFGLLGPNGGGKTTLFRILSTATQPSGGRVSILGQDLNGNPATIRSRIGVIFQNPSLDKKLTAFENLIHQGRLYGMSGPDLVKRADALLTKFNLFDRRHDRVEILSGGLQRRVDIIKGLLHKPEILLMDEPGTGLDPSARRDVWDVLTHLREEGVTILLTTHLMEEAEKCDRVAILNRGKVVALGTPEELKNAIGGDVITIQARQPEALKSRLEEEFKGAVQLVNGILRMEINEGHKAVPMIVEMFPGLIEAVSVGKPTLEDVFIHRAGRKFSEDESE